MASKRFASPSFRRPSNTMFSRRSVAFFTRASGAHRLFAEFETVQGPFVSLRRVSVQLFETTRVLGRSKS